MILTDREIKNSLAARLTVIDPVPPDDAFASTTVDLTLDPILRIFRDLAPGLSASVDPGLPGYKAKDLLAAVTDPYVIPASGFDLIPGKLVLGWTKERLELPLRGRVAARVEGKSGLARVGLAIHCTAPIIHSGFEGTIQLEIVNHGPMPIKLRPGISICQLCFEQTLGMPDNAYKGQFLGQTAAPNEKAN
jgi:dCTP deaminase